MATCKTPHRYFVNRAVDRKKFWGGSNLAPKALVRAEGAHRGAKGAEGVGCGEGCPLPTENFWILQMKRCILVESWSWTCRHYKWLIMSAKFMLTRHCQRSLTRCYLFTPTAWHLPVIKIKRCIVAEIPVTIMIAIQIFFDVTARSNREYIDFAPNASSLEF